MDVTGRLDPNQHADATQRFWDTNYSISEDPLNWMANPACRATINRRVTGDPHCWPLDGLARTLAGRRFRRGLSLGCGLGAIERWVRSHDLCEEITGIDISPSTLEVARERARAEGLLGITYEIGDMNQLDLPADTYDLVFIHQSLHHVVGVEKLLTRVSGALTRDGLLFLDEWTGPSRDEWTTPMIQRARDLYAQLPAGWRRMDVLDPPILAEDPSEAVRSSAILPSARLFFDLVERPYGGQLAAVLLSQLDRSAFSDPTLGTHVASWLAMEDEDLRTHPERSYYAVAEGRPYRGLRRTIALVRAAGRRASLRLHYSVRPLARLVRGKARAVLAMRKVR
jgi:SAM-dependent methyltransferase